MTKFYIIDNRFNSECKREYFLDVIVTAQSKRKAQNKAKKIVPALSFSGAFGAMCLTQEQAMEFTNLRDKAGYQVFTKQEVTK